MKTRLICFFMMILTLYFLPVTAVAVETDINHLHGLIEEGFTDTLEYRHLLINFQADHNLVVDGVLGSHTQQALDAYETDDIIINLEDKVPIDDEWFIVINKSTKILTVYNLGKIYEKYPVALGKSSTPTPNYKFTIINKYKDPYWGGMNGTHTPVAGGAPNNPLGRRWMGLSRDSYVGYGIHGNSNPWSVGSYVSSGCIRMINSQAEEIFEYIPLHTKVWIGTEDVLNEWGVSQNIAYTSSTESSSTIH
ncbi:L,D-transpeptidase family protein [Vallitalea okinawensis]|uniref:L,D-transpeptidase family protein n=1 Tax=Vallitalea okinawensis TaxID=2078660 RepID=UPI000CFCF3C2|nr:L,D-transpeptidase [Vallitalea okinawensis]